MSTRETEDCVNGSSSTSSSVAPSVAGTPHGMKRRKLNLSRRRKTIRNETSSQPSGNNIKLVNAPARELGCNISTVGEAHGRSPPEKPEISKIEPETITAEVVLVASDSDDDFVNHHDSRKCLDQPQRPGQPVAHDTVTSTVSPPSETGERYHGANKARQSTIKVDSRRCPDEMPKAHNRGERLPNKPRRRRRSVLALMRTATANRQPSAAISNCPVCSAQLPAVKMQRHIDTCLQIQTQRAASAQPSHPGPQYELEPIVVDWLPASLARPVAHAPCLHAALKASRKARLVKDSKVVVAELQSDPQSGTAAVSTSTRSDPGASNTGAAPPPEQASLTTCDSSESSKTTPSHHPGNCFICHDPGHFARDCPQGPYYVFNFRCMLNHVMDLDVNRSLFCSCELSKLGHMLSLDAGPTRLLARLYPRKWAWLRLSSLKYPEVGNMGAAVQTLVSAGILDTQDLMTPRELLECLSGPELSELRKTLRVGVTSRPPSRSGASSSSNGPGGTGAEGATSATRLSKQMIIDAILSSCQSQGSLFGGKDGRMALLRKRALHRLGPCIRVSKQTRFLLRRVEVLFFMKTSLEDSDLSTMYLARSERWTFPSYKVNITCCPFTSRVALAQYLHFLDLEKQLEDLIMSGRLDEAHRLVSNAQQHTFPAKDMFDANCLCEDPEPSSDASADLAALKEPLSPDLMTLSSEGRDSTDLTAQTQPESKVDFLNQFKYEWIRTRVLSDGVQVLERRKDHERAVELLKSLLNQPFAADRRGRWYDRLSVNLKEHLGDPKAALETCIEGLKDPLVRTGHKLAMLRRARRLCQHKGLPELHPHLSRLPEFGLTTVEYFSINGRIVSDRSTGSRLSFLDASGSVCSVEDLVLQHVGAMSWRGVHCEGSLFGTLFGLLFWDVIFSDVPDVFRTQYQACPIDFATDFFYQNRQTQIQAHIEWLHTQDLVSIVEQAWKDHYGVMCVGVSWDAFDLQTLLEAVAAMGHRVLLGACELLARDYRHRRGGLPDLFLWKVDDQEASCMFVEVKSPKDRLSEKQEIWLHVLTELGARAAVCTVKDTGGRVISTSSWSSRKV